MNDTTRDILCTKLTSNKASERQEALQTLQDAFAREQNFTNYFLKKSKPNVFVPFYTALFHTVTLEQEGMKKPSSRAAATRRCSVAGSMIRRFTEHTVQYMTKSGAKGIITDILLRIGDHIELFQPIALDYAKSLKVLISFTPHLEHMLPEVWIRLIELCFNVILGDPIKASLADELESPTPAADDDMYVDNDTTEDETRSPNSLKGKNKRTRHDPSPKPILSGQAVKTKPRGTLHTAVSPEQIEFASILSIILASPIAPILIETKPPSYLPGAIMARLRRFLEHYPADSSLLLDYIRMLSSVLDHLSLNTKHEIQAFARSTWTALVSLWGTKDKHLKESLVVVLRHLFPYTVCPIHPELPKLPPFDPVDGIGHLWYALDAEAENKWGVDGLALDALRLELAKPNTVKSGEQDAFVAKTFRLGWNFDAEQALSWAILELRADCAGQLFQFSESMQPSTSATGTSRAKAKRIKLETPITSLLQSIQAAPTVRVRNYHLQTLLFFVDRHWIFVHDSQKQAIVDILQQYVSVEDSTSQSWIFLNFAAIAFAEGTRTHRKPSDIPFSLDTQMWDSIWTHAIRRANAPVICRAACHACHAMLTTFYSQTPKPSQVFLTSSRILQDIEAFTKDMDVQGPSYPFDAVCIFISHCLGIASQDARLYRMNLEDTVISWFINSWKLTRVRSKMAPYAIVDILLLLETVCGLSKRVDLPCRTLPPKSEIVEAIIKENKTKVIRDFLLYAKIPPLAQETRVSQSPLVAYTAGRDNATLVGSISTNNQGISRGKERRIRVFFLTTLESLNLEWENSRDNNVRSAELARQSLDIAISAIIFDSLLVLNGFGSDRIMLQNAANIIILLSNSLVDPKWSTTERLLVAQALEVLLPEESFEDDSFRQVLLYPGPDSGIKEQTLRHILAGQHDNTSLVDNNRLEFLGLLWKNVEDAFNTINAMLKKIIGLVTGRLEKEVMYNEDNDGFGAIRTANDKVSTLNVYDSDNDRPKQRIMEICIAVLACGPFFQSHSPGPTRDKNLASLVISIAPDDPDMFSFVAPIFFNKIRQGFLTLSTKELNTCFNHFSELLKRYAQSQSERLLHVLTDLLICYLEIRKSGNITAQDPVHTRFIAACTEMARRLDEERVGSWVLRDAFIRFMDKYLLEDPTETLWTSNPPTLLLPALHADKDMRVRFRAALVNTRLYSLTNVDPVQTYIETIKCYEHKLDEYEHMLTRNLTLGNIMIASSAVRRGPYWHLLETWIHRKRYTNHTEAIITGVSERLGMPTLSALFVAYASQIAYSVHRANADITQFPPHLLGYKTRKQSAEAAFPLFTPTNLIKDARERFEDHCKILGKSVTDGLQESFGDIIGVAIATRFYQVKMKEKSIDNLEEDLKSLVSPLSDFWHIFRRNLDGIIIMILKCLGEQDISENSSIIADLRIFDNEIGTDSASVFLSLSKFRSSDTFRPHEPHLPSYSAEILLTSLQWISSRLEKAFIKATTFHVIHQLMEEVHKTPLVNEQYRLVNGLLLWMAYRRPDLEDPTILTTIIHGATLLLSQSDLTRSAQSILDVAFQQYQVLASTSNSSNSQDFHLPDSLLRICCIAQDFITVSNYSISKIGSELLEWVDQQMFSFAQIDILKPVICRALAAWPHKPPEQLMSLYDETLLSNLTVILDDHHLSSNKFKLVRRMKDQAAEGSIYKDQFSKENFWRLKECMPPPDHLQDEDVQAFTQLLCINHGKIPSFSFNTEHMDLNAPRARQRRMFKKRGATDDALALDALSLGLLRMLEDNDASRVSNAYRTLRLIMASIPDEEPRHVPPEFRAAVKYLRVYKPIRHHRSIRDIESELASDALQESATDFKRWISDITTLFSDTLAASDSFFGQLDSILTSDADYAEEILPVLVYTLLFFQRTGKLPCIPNSMPVTLSKYFTEILKGENTDLRCIQSIVDIALHLRYFTPRTNDPLEYDKWLNIDYALLAHSAVLCGAYTTALLFLEIDATQKATLGNDSTSEQVMYEIYSHIDEPDGFYGIQTEDLNQFLIKRLHHEKQWDKAFRFHGAALEAGNPRKAEEEGLLESFHHFGFDHLAIDTSRNLPGQPSTDPSVSSSMNYNLAWRTGTWDLPDRSQDASTATLYRSLRAVHCERDSRLVDSTLNSAFLTDMSRLRSLGSENLAEIKSVTQELMCLGQIMNWRNDSTQRCLGEGDLSLDSWKEFINIDSGFQFSDLESIMATRISLVRSIREREERESIGTITRPLVKGLIELEKNCLLRLSEAARTSDQRQIALNSVVRAQKLEKIPSPEVSEEFANVLWVHGEERLAVKFLRRLLDYDNDANLDAVGDHTRRAIWLSRLGTWTSEACLEKPAEIWTHYFDSSIKLLEKVQRDTGLYDASHAKIYRECAMFSERQYHSALKSPEAIRLKVYIERKKKELESLNAVSAPHSKPLEGEKKRIEVVINNDTNILSKHETLRDTSLQQAIDMHSRCLEISDAFDNDSATRLCSLWLANFDDPTIQKCVKLALGRIPSRKLVFLAHQLTARLASIPSINGRHPQENLQRLILRMCQEHPFHVLYQVYCLSNHVEGNTRKSSYSSSQLTQTDRSTAANGLLDRLRANGLTGQRIRDVEKLCDAYLQWAKYPLDKTKHKSSTSYNVPSGIKILKISNLKVPITTVHTPLDPTLKYDNCITIDHYEATFSTAGGVNLPKISGCFGSDGEKYKQLFKSGNDDLRQDAVMEQVFDLVNGVLKRDRESRRRNLNVRDYKVIPLSSQAGLLEFVGQTTPLMAWLEKAHPRYDIKPNLSLSEARSKFRANCESPRYKPEQKVQSLLDIQQKFKPVLRHYFTEKHKNPINWFQMRLSYTRSVATTSIVGHMLGLGDRHSSNILIDYTSGEVVHIDLGIAFDQGKLLGFPERVPFRMTPEIRDGMGPSGTNGVFQRCAEETLRVLREESGVIMTVLEVFKHDPLHSWTANEMRLKKVQEDYLTTATYVAPLPATGFGTEVSRVNLGIGIDMTSGSADEAADRALNSVARKLDKSLSVESTVNELVAEATDLTNLATMYTGWGPFL